MCNNMRMELNLADDNPVLNIDKTDTVYTLWDRRPLGWICAGFGSLIFAKHVPISPRMYPLII